jgi:DNA transformation protein
VRRPWRTRPQKASFALTAVIVTTSADFLAYVLDQLAGLQGVSSRRMFGGAGLYCDEFFFGLIADDVLYLRVDDSNRADYSVRGMAQFRPYADRPHLSMNYYETPADVLENASELVTWVRRSVAVAMRAPKAAAKRKSALVRRRRSR